MKPKEIVLALLAALALGTAVPATAGIDRFTPFGPMNGAFRSLVVDPYSPATLLAAVDLNGLFRSDDGGHAWAWSGFGMGRELPQALAADPAQPGVFYAISANQAFRSDDGGRHWIVTASNQDFGQPFFSTFTDDLAYPRLVAFVAPPLLPRAPKLLAGTGPFLERSADGGSTWTRVYTAESPETRWSFAVDPTTGNPRIWAGFQAPQGGGLLTSADGGQTWTRVPNLPAPFALGVLALLAVPTQPVTLFASAGNSVDENVFKSTDGGLTWREVAFGTPHPLAVTAFAYEPGTPTIVYAAAGDTPYWSGDGGETWQRRGAGFSPAPIRDLAAVPPRTLYALTNQSLERSADRARHWTAIARSGRFSYTPSLRIRFVPGDPSTIYVVEGGGIWKSADGGATWASLATALDPTELFEDLAVDPADPRLLDLASTLGIFQTRDGGATRSLLTPVQVGLLAIADRRLTLAADCGVLRSTDGGKTWKRTLSCDPGLPGDFEGRTVTRLLLAPREPGVVYAGLVNIFGRHPPFPFPQVWKSTDSGATWRQIVADSDVVALDPARRGRLYVAGPAGIERSDDGGRTFRTVSGFGVTPSPTGTFVNDLAVDPATPATLYAATSGQGVWRSTDGGVTWASISAGLARFGELDDNSVVVDPAVPHRLYVGAGGWIFENQLTEP